jgi:hypothetical protein
MTDIDSPTDLPRKPGLASRIVGVLFSPRTTYPAIVARPAWLGVTLITVLLSAGAQFWLSTPSGQKAMQDTAEQQIRVMLQVAPNLPDQALERMRNTERAAYSAAAAVVISVVVTIVLLAGILLGIFNGLAGGAGRYKQVLAVVAFSSLIWMVSALFDAGIGYLKGEMVGAGRLAGLFPMIDDNGFVGALLKTLNVFWFWGLVNLAIGVAVLYKRRTAPIATSFIAVYLVIAFLIAVVRSSLGV